MIVLHRFSKFLAKFTIGKKLLAQLQRVWRVVRGEVAPRDFDDENRRQIYAANISKASKIAAKIHLVHVVRGKFVDMILTPPAELNISVAGSQPNTRQAEETLNLGNCLYFYAGRALKRVGGVALAFNASCESGHTGDATPFDSGGLVGGRIQSNLADEQAKINYCNSCRVDLQLWRQEFAKYLAAYFSQIGDYWEGRPAWNDAAGILLHPENTWQAWTYEVRFREPQAILDVEKWCISQTERVLYYQKALASVTPPWEKALLLDFAKKELPAMGTRGYAQELETWVRREAGV
jgi:hypothetical protein